MAIDWSKVRAKCLKICIDQFLIISYVIAAVIALAWPVPGKAVLSVEFSVNGHKYQVFKILNIMIVFLISGLLLKTDDIKKAWQYKLGVAFGFLSTLAITPCLGFAFRAIPLTPLAYTIGLVLTTAVPQTLGIGISLVRSCGGNEGLALMLTVGTNVIGIFTMPLWLKALFSDTDFLIIIDMVSLLVNLLLSVLVPSIIGKALRDLLPAVRAFVTRHRVGLSLFSTLNLALIVWQVLSGAQGILMENPFVDIVYVFLLSAGQHLLYLAFDFSVTTLLLRLPPPENISVALMASQKSGPVAVAVIGYLTSDLSTQGLMALPAVLGQLVQVFIGSALVPYFSKVTKHYRQAQKVAAEEAAVADAAGKLEGGGGGDGGGSDGGGDGDGGGGSKRGLALAVAAVAADVGSEGKEPPSNQPFAADSGSQSPTKQVPQATSPAAVAAVAALAAVAGPNA